MKMSIFYKNIFKIWIFRNYLLSEAFLKEVPVSSWILGIVDSRNLPAPTEIWFPDDHQIEDC